MTRRQLLDFVRRVILDDYKKNPKIFWEHSAPINSPKPAQLANQFATTEVGDPLSDVELNQMVSEETADEKIATAVVVKAGAEKKGDNVTAGQRKPVYTSKTKAPQKLPGTEND